MNQVDYDHFWDGRWQDMILYSPAPRIRRKLVRKIVGRYFRPGASILDVGCGSCLLLKELGEAFPTAKLAGCDLSEKIVAENTRLYPHLTFAQLNLSDPLPIGQTYDLITCTEVLEHVPDFDQAMKNLWNFLNPGGILVVTVPGGKLYPIDQQVGHLRHFEDPTPFRGKGFEVLALNYWGFPFFNLYKYLINIDPEWSQSSFNEGAYTPKQKLISNFIYGLFNFNLPFAGEQLFVVLQKK